MNSNKRDYKTQTDSEGVIQRNQSSEKTTKTKGTLEEFEDFGISWTVNILKSQSPNQFNTNPYTEILFPSIQFLLTNTSCPTFNKKLQGMLKARKIRF